MSMLSQVHVARRFQRSIRIDTDLHDLRSLEGSLFPWECVVLPRVGQEPGLMSLS
jgi:hypothetical protein